uniref:WD40 repeat domain 95 n=1 Tax=Sander lucioperca TaxID=283035 RepID=A0A8C9YGJ4_SANLU
KLMSVLTYKHSLLVTGGMDRLIRMWNPHFSGKPTGILKGHSAPIIYLCIFSEDSQIFSVSIDRSVKIWDIQDQCCLFTADPKASGIHGDISACSSLIFISLLFILLSLASVRPRLHSRLTVSHNETVMCCGYNEEFRQVVSCTEGSVVKVWDFDTGRQVFEFGGTHNLSAITCMTFDPKGRRLVTGGRDGSLKIWNFNNGQCLKTLKKDGECHEVCDCIFLQVHRNLMEIKLLDSHFVFPQKNGHKDDILCVAQCPPSLIATSSYDGEIIVWNVVSGRIQCRFVSPLLAEHQNVEGDFGAKRMTNIVNKNSDVFRTLHLFDVFLSVTQDWIQSSLPEMPSLISFRVSLFWSSLQIVDNDQVVLTSSADYTVRLWSAHGEFIGTFGQPESWSVHIPSSWKHPAVPYQVLIDPLSMPDHEILNVKTHLSDAINPDKTEG